MLNIFSLARKLDTDWHSAYDRTVDGDIPAPVFVGNYARWRESVINEWLQADCPVGEELDDDAYNRLQDALLAELKALDARKETI